MQPSINQVEVNVNKPSILNKRIEIESINFKNPLKEEDISQNQLLFGAIKRNRVKDVQQYPYCCMGYLYIQFKASEQKRWISNGTAILVSPDIILTCAHNIFNVQLQLQAQNLQFYLGVNGKTQLHHTLSIKKPYIYPTQYKTKNSESNNQKNNDWAFLVLEEPINFGVEFIPLPIIVDFPKTNYEIGIYGYPKDKISQDYPSIYIYGAKGKYQLYDDFFIYDIDTFNGQSGSAVIVHYRNGIDAVIGIHIRGLTDLRKNLANRLTYNKMKQANQMMRLKYSGKQIPYQLYQQ